jgi:hypothetical protein
MSHRSILGADGAIAQRLPNYEPRAEQLQMADAVASALAGPDGPRYRGRGRYSAPGELPPMSSHHAAL